MKPLKELISKGDEETVFACPPDELSCLIGNLFGELATPCTEVHRGVGLVICGYTHSGRYGVLSIHKDYCCFKGAKEDLEAVRGGICVERRCNRG